LEVDPKSSVTWNNLGQTYLFSDKLEPAADALSKAFALDPNADEVVNGLCFAYARLKQSEQAVSFCEKARAVNSSFLPTYYLGWSYLDMKRYPEAIKTLQDCVRLDPRKAYTYIALAEGYSHLNRFKEAVANAQKAIELSPDSSSAYASLGFVYYQMKKPKEAKTVLQKALALAPESISARYNLAMTCLALKQKDCAREQYAILKTVEPGLSTQLLDQIYSSKVVRLLK
jgi:tetratricopeptide (TPR) repeat protein